jgi:hypothetical protein
MGLIQLSVLKQNNKTLCNSQYAKIWPHLLTCYACFAFSAASAFLWYAGCSQKKL